MEAPVAGRSTVKVYICTDASFENVAIVLHLLAHSCLLTALSGCDRAAGVPSVSKEMRHMVKDLPLVSG